MARAAERLNGAMFRSKPVQPRGAMYQATSQSDPAATRKPAVGAVPLTALSVVGPTSARGNTVGGVVHALSMVPIPFDPRGAVGKGWTTPRRSWPVEAPPHAPAHGRLDLVSRDIGIAVEAPPPRAPARPGTLGRLRKREPSARGARGACPSQGREPSARGARGACPSQERALSPGSARALPPLARKRALSPGARAPQPGECPSLETPGSLSSRCGAETTASRESPNRRPRVAVQVRPRRSAHGRWRAHRSRHTHRVPLWACPCC